MSRISQPSDHPLEALGFWEFAYFNPDEPALICQESTVTYGQLAAKVNRLSHLFRALGMKSGDHLGYIVPNGVSVYEITLACSQIGVLYTPINHQLLSEEVEYILRDSEAKLLVAHEQYGAIVRTAADAVGMPNHARLSYGSIPTFEDITLAADAYPSTLPEDRTAGSLFYYTSGTTGRPKGVVHLDRSTDLRTAITQAVWSAISADYSSRTGIFLVQGALYFSGSLIPSTWMLHVGGSVVIMEKWGAQECLALIDRFRVTATFVVPTMLYRLLALPDEIRQSFDGSSLVPNAVLLSGAICPADVKRAMIDWWGPVFFESYGSSEGRFVTSTSQEWSAHKGGGVGRPGRDTTIKILDEEGRERPAGEVGLIYANNGTLQSVAYFKSPEKAESQRVGDFFTIGDMGYLDEEGWLHVSDRRDDLIVSGGANIYPAEVEAVLMRHPLVVDVGVIGVPNAEWGHEVKAVVQPLDSKAAGPELEAEIISFSHQHLAKYKCPRSVEFLTALPRSDSGKLYRRRLRDTFLSQIDG